MITNLDGRFKETDLFKVYQTIDLANLDPANPEHKASCHSSATSPAAPPDVPSAPRPPPQALTDRLPNLMRLRDALYTPDFRRYVSEVTGCGELSDRVVRSRGPCEE